MLRNALLTVVVVASATAAHADTFTRTSPTGGLLPSNVSAVGGVVTDLVGINGNRVVAQVSAGSEFIGNEQNFPTVNGSRWLTFGIQTGITSAVVNALGGGIASASFRLSLYDGDSQAGNFDFNQDSLYVSATGGTVGTTSTSSTGTNLGNFSTVVTHQTDGTGNQISSNLGPGFGNNILDTGFFSSTNSTTLAALYNQLVTASVGDQMLRFQLNALTNGDQYYDFKQGLDASVIDVGSGPVVVATTPEPNSLILLGTGALAVAGVVRRKLRRT